MPKAPSVHSAFLPFPSGFLSPPAFSLIWTKPLGVVGSPTSPLGREWSKELVLLNSLLPLRGGGSPSPYPLPLDLEGVGREELERPRWPKMAPRGPQRAQDGPQDRAR